VRILADENVPRAIVVWLRQEGHDVFYASESRAQTSDADLLAEAEAQGYVVLTEDKDFGDPKDPVTRARHASTQHPPTMGQVDHASSQDH
jgi:predicted nuclease of predicted toxin-antitoxin system